MANDTEDTGTIEALLQRLNEVRLPRLLELKEREHQMTPSDREALQTILLERRLIDVGNPNGSDRRKADLNAEHKQE